MIEGSLPNNAISMIRKWAKEYQKELEENWAAIEAEGTLHKIEPLE